MNRKRVGPAKLKAIFDWKLDINEVTNENHEIPFYFFFSVLTIKFNFGVKCLANNIIHIYRKMSNKS